MQFTRLSHYAASYYLLHLRLIGQLRELFFVDATEDLLNPGNKANVSTNDAECKRLLNDASTTSTTMTKSNSDVESYNSCQVTDNCEYDIEERFYEDIPIEYELDSNNDDLFFHYGATLMLALLGYVGAVCVPGVEVVWSVLGSSLGLTIAFVMPCACYLKIRASKGMNDETD